MTLHSLSIFLPWSGFESLPNFTPCNTGKNSFFDCSILNYFKILSRYALLGKSLPAARVLGLSVARAPALLIRRYSWRIAVAPVVPRYCYTWIVVALFGKGRYWYYLQRCLQESATGKATLLLNFPPSLLLVLLVFSCIFFLYLNRLYTIIFSILHTYKCNHSIYIQIVSSNHVIIIIIIQHKVVSLHHLENSDTSLEWYANTSSSI